MCVVLQLGTHACVLGFLRIVFRSLDFLSFFFSLLPFSYFFFPFWDDFFPFLGKTITPKAASEVKLISSGKILENNKTVGQCKLPFGEFTGGVTIMHVVVQPSLAKAKTGDSL